MNTILRLAILASCLAILFSSCDKTEEIENPGFCTDTRDGHEYKTITLGNQIWMAENLAYLPEVIFTSDTSGSASRFYVYDFNGSDVAEAKATENYKTFGVLYNISAAINICPSGWHLPSQSEWNELVNYLNNNGYSSKEGGLAKSVASVAYWYNSTIEGTPGKSPETNNSSTFNGLPGGYFHPAKGFQGFGIESTWWSSTLINGNMSQGSRLLQYDNIDFQSALAYYPGLGLYIRCIKD